MAHELLQVHAARELTERPPFSATDGYYEEFCARFPFEETPGQQAAIDDVVADLLKSKPVDRLVCGDVGYGKTEVALRAAFLAAVDGPWPGSTPSSTSALSPIFRPRSLRVGSPRWWNV